MICEVYNLSEIFFYSHVTSSVVTLLVALIVFLNGRHRLLNKLLFAVALSFSLWTLVSYLSWSLVNGDLISSIWPFFGVLSALISVLCIYFVYVFVYNRNAPFKLRLIYLLLLVPVMLFAHTNLSLKGFDLASCDAFIYEGIPYKLYYSALGYLAMAWIAYILFKGYRNVTHRSKTEIILMGIGIELFLLIFNTTSFVSTSLTTYGYTDNSDLEYYGLFGMVVFMVFVSILIVRFRSFNVGMLAAQALVIALLVLVGSQFTFVETTTGNILTSITLIITGVIGILLLRNVKKEIAQRQEIEALAVKLSKANDRLKSLDKLKSEFVSIASHQLRSPLTAIRGYSSMLLEGSFGSFPAKAREALERIDDTTKFMATSIEDYLNVSRIESGNMKYENTDVNVKELAEHVVDDLRKMATQKGLVLSLKSDLNSKAISKIDLNKAQQVIHNLINNALKYTEKGSVTVFVHDDVKKKKIYVEIIDTGIGMSEETLATLFGKFERAKSSTVASIKGTGLGLFVARQMAQGMKGDVTAYSEGEGKGSHFILELPLMM